MNRLVKYLPEEAAFDALGDPTRRHLLRSIAAGTTSPSALAKDVDLSLPGTLKHLGVLERAGLLTRSKTGRTVTLSLRPEPLAAAEEWLRRTRIFWTHQLGNLAESFDATHRSQPEEPS